MSKIYKYKRSDGSVTYTVKAFLGYDLEDGKQNQVTRRGFSTKKEARAFLYNLLSEVDKNGVPSKKKKTFEEIYEEWFEQHQKRIKPSTSKSIESKFTKRILPKFGHLEIKKITHKYCQQVINEWSEELKSFKDLKIQLNLVFKYSIKMSYLSQNPLDKVTLPKAKDEHYVIDEYGEKQNYYTREELLDFLESIKSEPLNYTFFHLAAYTGARKGELLALKWSDINFSDGLLHISKTLYFENKTNHLFKPKTTESKRSISLDPDTLSVLEYWKAEQQDRYTQLDQPVLSDSEQYIFTKYHQFKKRITIIRTAYFNDQISRILKHNPHLRKISVHGFRHTHASLLISAQASANEVKERLGHADIRTTLNTYVHLMKEDKLETANKFHEFMNKPY
ncbi:tyrosine-type recombinase/integrase [Alkalibacillus silvisoli]|uniref:Site-specific integrase n=1 Tax=Alkalibacillus silvisoli TaxID=392823 RepID=A0ABN1A8U0_9BACI